MRLFRTATLLALFCSASASLPAQVVNGDFETGNLTGWTISSCGFTGVDGGASHSGSFGLFSGNIGSPCVLTQSVSTTIGTQYSFSFWLRNVSGGSPNSFQALFGGQSLLSSIDGPGTGYALQTFNVTATSTSSELRFQLRHDPSFWDLDDVSLTPTTVTPEPSTVALIAAGLGALAVIRRRRRL